MDSKHPPKDLVGQREHPGVCERTPGGQEGFTKEKRYLREELAGAVSVHDHLATIHLLAPPELSFKDHVQVVDGLTFPPTDLAGWYELLRALFENLPQLLVGQPLEEGHLAQFFEGRHGALSWAGLNGRRTSKRMSPSSEKTRISPQRFPRISHPRAEATRSIAT